MKRLMVHCLILCMIAGCTTWRPIGNVPSDLPQHFSDGGALHPGDRVIVTTVAGVRHRLRILSVQDGVIYGDHDSVPFSEVASIERRDFNATKTTLLVVVIVGIIGGLAAAISSASHPKVNL